MANSSSGLTEVNQKNLFVKQVNALSKSADFSFILPQGAHIIAISISETAGNAITGGLDIGTTAAGVDVASAIAVGASSSFAVAQAAILKNIFTGSPTLFFTAHTSWNGAIINVNVIYVARVEFRS